MHSPEIEEPMQDLQTAYFLAASITRPYQKCMTSPLDFAILQILLTGRFALLFFLHSSALLRPHIIHKAIRVFGRTERFELVFYPRSSAHSPTSFYAYQRSKSSGEPNALLPFFSSFVFTFSYLPHAYNGPSLRENRMLCSRFCPHFSSHSPSSLLLVTDKVFGRTRCFAPVFLIVCLHIRLFSCCLSRPKSSGEPNTLLSFFLPFQSK
jgi:hypothetical protein